MNLSMCHLTLSLATNQAAQPFSRGFLLLLALATLLGAFIIGVLLLNLARRNRRKTEDARRLAEREARSNEQVDPWFEAGRRTKTVDDEK